MERECEVRTVTSSGGVARRSCSVLVASPSQDTLLLFGGVGANTYFNDMHAYNIETRTWAECYPIGSRPSPRGSCASTVVQQRTLYVFGGRGEDGFLADLYNFDMVHMGWSPVHAAGQRPGAREDSVMATSSSGLIYLLGGCGSSGAEADLWRFDPSQAHWDLIDDTVPAFPDGVAAPCMAHSDHHMYVFGGYDKFGAFMDALWRYSMREQSWSRIEIRGGVPRPRTHGQLALCDGNLLLYGGYYANGALSDVWQLISVGTELPSDDCFVIIGEELRTIGGVDTVVARGAAASAVAQRSLFVFGGCDGSTFLQDLLTISLASVERSPARRQVIHSKAWVPHSNVSGGQTFEHPYNVASPFTSTTNIVASSPAVADGRSGLTTRAPSLAPTQLTYADNNARFLTSGGKPVTSLSASGLMHAIADLKSELFGPRVAHVDTIMEENRKLREENAKLQQTVLDLMRKLSQSGVPHFTAATATSTVFPAQHAYQHSDLPTAAFSL